MKYKPFKMKGNPFKRNFGIGESPMKGYKSDAQRKAVHASKAEKSAMSMKHEGPMKAYHTAMKKHDGKTFDDAGFMDSHFPSGAPRSAAKMAHGKKSAMKKRSLGFMDSHFPSGAPRSAAKMYGKKSPAKMAHDKAPAKMAHGKKSAMKKRSLVRKARDEAKQIARGLQGTVQELDKIGTGATVKPVRAFKEAYREQQAKDRKKAATKMKHGKSAMKNKHYGKKK